MSVLRDRAEDYVRMRRALGYKREVQGWLLGEFIGYLEQAGAGTVTIEHAVAWATLPAAAQRSYWAQRLSVVREFARHLRTIDPACEIPPANVLPFRPRRAIPHLYQPQEITALMTAAGTLPLALQAATYRTLIGLLAVTGLRLGEAIRLNHDDIDTDHQLLRILNSKFAKSREVAPARLALSQLDAPTIGAFLEHLETDRGNSARTRNLRLAAVHSFFNDCALRHPEHAALIARVLSIPTKRSEKRIVTFLQPDEVKALLASPDRSTSAGRRDHALLLTGVQTGLRVSELIGLTNGDVHLGTGPHLRTFGKGRKERVSPLTSQTVDVLKVWTRERGGLPGDPLFPTLDVRGSLLFVAEPQRYR